ncbi:hypothetical protein AB0L41_48550 [Amycolatopsis mediterranei]|uniref:hypothetical protein n=1 Tax=Amycolatopsis mediterranei TaxID=33910 RepID=UPI00344753B3
MRTSSRLLGPVVAVAATAAGVSGLAAVSAAHRRSRRQHQRPQLHTPLTDMQRANWQHQNDRNDQVLAAVADYLSALSRGEQPPPWPPESVEAAAGPDTAVVGHLLEVRHHGDDAGQFDLTRTPLTKHLAFGDGPHVCLGATLARLEATIAVRELFTRYPDLTLAADPADLTPVPSLFSNSLTALAGRLTTPTNPVL